VSSTVEASRTPIQSQVVMTFSLAARELASLQAELGPRYKVLDVHRAVDADIVICPPCSTRTIEKLKRQYPTAAIVVVEPDEGSGSLDAPVTRLLVAGATAYVTDASPEGLASAIHALGAAPRT
jgi:DNA-binding NarL/FixJ family response regulator